MQKKIITVISILGTVASIFSLIFTGGVPLWIRILIGVVGVILIVLLAIIILKGSHINRIVCKSDAEIKATMKKLIKTQGKVCIVSRDLSWVDNSVETILKKKGGSLLIFAEAESDLTRRLISSGVTIKYYGALGYEPKTRFTVLRYNRNNSQVAISNTINTMRSINNIKHTIYETGFGNEYDSWINSLALDLINLLNQTSK